MPTKYDKLVRDRIPEKLAAKGLGFSVHAADDEEYVQKLRAKLLEEVQEFLRDESPEEMADVLEVLEAFARLKGWRWSEVQAKQKQKAEQRGRFEKRIILEEIGES